MNLKHSNLIVQSLIYQARRVDSPYAMRQLLIEAVLQYEIHHEHLLHGHRRLSRRSIPA